MKDQGATAMGYSRTFDTDRNVKTLIAKGKIDFGLKRKQIWLNSTIDQPSLNLHATVIQSNEISF